MRAILDKRYVYEAVPVGNFPSIQVQNDQPVFDDAFIFTVADGPGPLGQNTVTRFDTQLGLEWVRMQLILIDRSRSVFATPDLPDAFGLQNFDSARFIIRAGINLGPGYRIEGNVSSISQIPSPAPALLLISGIAGLRSRWKSAMCGTTP